MFEYDGLGPARQGIILFSSEIAHTSSRDATSVAMQRLPCNRIFLVLQRVNRRVADPHLQLGSKLAAIGQLQAISASILSGAGEPPSMRCAMVPAASRCCKRRPAKLPYAVRAKMEVLVIKTSQKCPSPTGSQLFRAAPHGSGRR